MDTIYQFILAEREEDEQVSSSVRITRRFIRNVSSPLDLPSTEFTKLFRLSKEAFTFVLQNISNKFKLRKSDATPTILKLAATLKLLGHGSYQKCIGQDFHIGLAQPTVSNVVSETLEILEQTMCPLMINFAMTDAEKREAKAYFFQKSGFPGVIMCIDGTQVAIVRPSVNEHHFYNRKGYHSINAMMACDHRMMITCVDASFGGSAHDSVIWSMSSEREYMENMFSNGDRSKILGDAGYSLEPWMMTPYRSTASGSREANYNTVHANCRCIIEKCFGMLKGRFRCLLRARELHYQPEKASRIINVCAMLHNICQKFKVDFDNTLFVEPEDELEEFPPEYTSNANVSRLIRDQIKDSL